MRIDYKKIVKVDELADLVPRKAGATWSALWQILYFTRLFKYVHRSHYPKIKVSYNKICTDRNLLKLCQLGYFKNPQPDIYCATKKVLPILKEAGFNTNILPPEPIGIGNINEIHNTDVFVQATKLQNFYTLLYYNFDYLVPDALMVQLDKDNKRYKLTFLEIEAQKPDWINYLETKRDNYLKLARDAQFYKYWSSVCNAIELPQPVISDLKFSVFFICKIKRDFGPGFTFREHLVN
jgi:hypothetical protein